MPDQDRDSTPPAGDPGGKARPDQSIGVRPSPGAAASGSSGASELSSDPAKSNAAAPGDGRTPVKSRAPGQLSTLWAGARLQRTLGFLGLALLAFNLLEFPRHANNPWHDPSSFASYEYYAAHHFQFGTEIYQNVGPYGYVH